LEQVTAIISGKRILGNPKEIQEVKNAFSAYEMLDTLSPIDERDLLKAHETLMMSLVNNPGHYRSSDVGVIKGKEVVHLAPPAERVPTLMHDLLAWLKSTDIHPLLASSIFHYEFEFIHPFLDGNGRMGRLWQTLILSKWKSILAFLPVETVVRNRQEEYYLVLGKSDQQGESTTFIAFMLHAIYDALCETVESDQDTDQVSDQVKKLLQSFHKNPLSASELMNILKLSHRPTFRKNYLHPALNNKFIEMTISNKPCSRLQKYIITPKGLKTRQYD
jgi:Fic family protein